MNLKKYKSVKEIPDRELLEAIFINQSILLREIRLQFRQSSTDEDKAEVEDPRDMISELIGKTSAFNDRINEVLKSS
ncbi:MAG: hypothetical protein QM743_03290 [Chitinophagaceae bacterium]